MIIYSGHLLKRYSVTYAVWKFAAITIAPLSTSSAAGVTRSEVVEAFWRGGFGDIYLIVGGNLRDEAYMCIRYDI